MSDPRDILERLHCTIRCDIETAASGCHCAEARDEIKQLRAALKEAVYEATHLSPQEPDGSHWAKMSAAWLARALAALAPQEGET